MLKSKKQRTGRLGHGLVLLFSISATFSPPSGSYAVSWMMAPEEVAVFSDTLDRNPSDSAAAPLQKPEAPAIGINKNAQRFIKDMLRRERESLDMVRKKSPAYFKIIETVFRQYQIPEELKYLAVVESELKPNAVSRVGAKGMWQFMSETGRDWGLKINARGDERVNVYKSTVAAAKYLRYLYSEFGDWLLVVAAYNGGPGSVDKAIKKSGSRNFWVLQHSLNQESRAHVKRFVTIHYYFEGGGSLATMTKAETIAYLKEKEAFALKQKETAPASDSLVVYTDPAVTKTALMTSVEESKTAKNK